jgi:hypothetical protein
MSGKTALSPPLTGWSLQFRATENQGFSARLLRDGGKEDARRWVSVAPPRQLRVALLAAADRAEDARYVEAALRAVAETAGETVTFDAGAATADWIFWLNDQPPPAEAVRAVTVAERICFRTPKVATPRQQRRRSASRQLSFRGERQQTERQVRRCGRMASASQS